MSAFAIAGGCVTRNAIVKTTATATASASIIGIVPTNPATAQPTKPDMTCPPTIFFVVQVAHSNL